MAPNFKFCSVLWIVVAVIAAHTVVLTEAATLIPTTTTTTTTTAAPGTTTTVPDPCASNPCGKGSTCEARFNQDFVCLCLAGDMYNNKTQRCETAKVFPGQIQLPDIVYENSMSDKASPAFKRTADLITQELDKSFSSNPTYIRSIVLELRPAGNSQSRASTPSDGVNATVDATVDIIYELESNITAADVVENVKKATDCDNCALKGATFKEENLCGSKACDDVTARCSAGDGTFNCTCKPDYIPSMYSDRKCDACPSGEKAVNSECVRCPFGHSGLNCNETWQLDLVIVGSVLGALLLTALVLLPLVTRMLSKKMLSTNSTGFFGNLFVNQSAPNAPLINGHSVNSHGSVFDKGSVSGLAAYTEGGVLRLPRAKVNNTWNSNTSPEMVDSNNQQNLFPAGRN